MRSFQVVYSFFPVSFFDPIHIYIYISRGFVLRSSRSERAPMPPKSGSPAYQSAGDAVSDTSSDELAVHMKVGKSSGGASVPASSSIFMARLAADSVRVYAEASKAILCTDFIGNRSPYVIATL